MRDKRENSRRVRLFAEHGALLVIAAIVGLIATSAPLGCRSEGEYVDLPGPHGYRHTGRLVNGERHGTWHIYWEDSLRHIERWKHGVKDGPQFGFFEDMFSSDINFWNGKEHGRSRSFSIEHPGMLLRLGWYSHGKAVGIFCSWNEQTGTSQIEHTSRVGVVEGPCPHTVGDGVRHLDPADRDYSFPPRSRARPIL